MKALLRLLLLLGAIFGLLWQGVAYASPPCAEMQKEQSAAAPAMADMADCMDAQQQSREKAPPCKDMKAGCLAMVGCASLAGLFAATGAGETTVNVAANFVPTPIPVLIGRSDAPIPDPPAILG